MRQGQSPQTELGEARDKCASHLQWRQQTFGEVSIMRRPLRRAAALEWSRPEPPRQTVCTVCSDPETQNCLSPLEARGS